MLRVVPMPADLNPSGDVFGGWIMSMVDIAGAVAGIRVARSAGRHRGGGLLRLRQPVSMGDIVSFHAEVVRGAHLDRGCRGSSAPPENPVVVKVTEARLTYVAVDVNLRASARSGAG